MRVLFCIKVYMIPCVILHYNIMNHALFKFLAAMFCIYITICICSCLVTTLKSKFYPYTLFETARCDLTYAYRYLLSMASFPRCLTCSKFVVRVNRGVATSTESPNGDDSHADIYETVDNIDSVIILPIALLNKITQMARRTSTT